MLLLACTATAAQVECVARAWRRCDKDDAGAVLELEDGGMRVSAETSRRLACDAGVVVMREAPDVRC